MRFARLTAASLMRRIWVRSGTVQRLSQRLDDSIEINLGNGSSRNQHMVVPLEAQTRTDQGNGMFQAPTYPVADHRSSGLCRYGVAKPWRSIFRQPTRLVPTPDL